MKRNNVVDDVIGRAISRQPSDRGYRYNSSSYSHHNRDDISHATHWRRGEMSSYHRRSKDDISYGTERRRDLQNFREYTYSSSGDKRYNHHREHNMDSQSQSIILETSKDLSDSFSQLSDGSVTRIECNIPETIPDSAQK